VSSPTAAAVQGGADHTASHRDPNVLSGWEPISFGRAS